LSLASSIPCVGSHRIVFSDSQCMITVGTEAGSMDRQRVRVRVRIRIRVRFSVSVRVRFVLGPI